MRLRKKPKPKNVGRELKPKIYMLSTGTVRQQTAPVGFDSEQKAKTAAVNFFAGWRAWAQRHNAVGVLAVEEAISEVSLMPVLVREHRVVWRCIDDYTEMTLCVHLWKEN